MRLVLEKAGRAVPVGTVHTWSDGTKHRKTQDGWVDVPDGGKDDGGKRDQAGSLSVDQLGSNADANAKSDPQKTARSAEQPYESAGIQLARPEQTVRPGSNYIPKNTRESLRDHQADFVNLAMEKYLAGEKCMLNMDGTGAGKTMQQLSLAEAYLKENPDARVLITTDNKRVINDAFMKDAKFLDIKINAADTDADITGPGIYVTAYNRLSKMESKFGEIGLAMFDESHNMKNRDSAKSKMGNALMKAADHVALLSATPMDKPEHIEYLCTAYGLKFFQVMGFLGYRFEKTSYGSKWTTNLNAMRVAENIDAFFEGLTEAGLAVKREVSLGNLDMMIKSMELTDDQRKRYEQAEEDFLERVDAAPGKKKGITKATGLLALRRLVEELKLDSTEQMVYDNLDNGKQVVLFATRVNESEIKGDTEDYSEGTLLELEKRLDAKGIKYASVFASNAKAKEEIAKFQKGDVKVILTTPQSGGTGLSLDDTTGNAPREAIVMTPPFSAMEFIQMIGRINRLTTKTRAGATMLATDVMIDSWNKDIIGNKLSTLGASVRGDYSAFDVADLEKVQYMSPKDAQEYMASKRRDGVFGTGSPVKFDVDQYKGADAKGVTKKDAAKAGSALARAPATTTYDRATITKAGDKFTIKTNGYIQGIVQALQAIPKKDRFWNKTNQTWTFKAQHYFDVTAACKRYANHTKTAKANIASAPATMGTQGQLYAEKKGDMMIVSFPYNRKIVDAIKGIPGRSWNNANKTWSVPANSWKALDKVFKDFSPKPGSGGTAGAVAGPQIDPAARAAAHAALQKLTSLCDGARKKDDCGFSGTDTQFGRSLAAAATLSDKQYYYARRMVLKYHRQLDSNTVDLVRTNDPGDLRKARYTMMMKVKPRPRLVIKSAATVEEMKQQGEYKEGDDISGISSAQLEAGIKVEMEHTEDRQIAEQIALDHLMEDPEYYAKLEKIEKGDSSWDDHDNDQDYDDDDEEESERDKEFERERKNEEARDAQKSIRLVIKAKPYPEGTVRKHGGRTMVKKDGGWVPATEGKADADRAREEKEKGKGKGNKSRKIPGDKDMHRCLSAVGGGKAPCLDDLKGKDRQVYNRLTKDGLITWKHLGSEEYVAELTENGKKALDGATAINMKKKRERKRGKQR